MPSKTYITNYKKGFTLIELLIVIAILGVLAAVILIALNPIQQLARTRDSARISTVNQIGHSLLAYATTRNGRFPDEDGSGTGGNQCTIGDGTPNWIECMVDAGEMSTVPGLVANSLNSLCTVRQVNGWCYDASSGTGTSPAITFSRLEANSNINKCAAGEQAYAVFSTEDGRGGVVCRIAGSPPVPGAQTFSD